VGIGVCNALAAEPFAAAVPPQKVVGIIDLVAALAQHGTVVFLADQLCSGLHSGRIGDLHAGKDLSLRNVGGDHLCHGQQLFGQCLHGIVPQQLGAGGGNHHRVHHDMLCTVGVQLFGDHTDQLCRGYHADLDGIRVDVGKNGVDLLCQKFGRGFKNAGHTCGVLGSQCGNGAHGVHAVCSHGFDIGLDASTAAGIAAGNRQCSFHGYNFLCKKCGNARKEASPHFEAAVSPYVGIVQIRSQVWANSPLSACFCRLPFFCVQEYHSAAAFARGWPFSIGPLRGKMEKTKGEIP